MDHRYLVDMLVNLNKIFENFLKKPKKIKQNMEIKVLST